MSRSLAPSPTAIASAGVRPSRAAISSSASALAARPRIGSATSPVSRPSASISRLARFSSKPSLAAMRDGERRRSRPRPAPSRRRGAHGRDQRAAAGGQRQAAGDDAVDDRRVEALEQRDALAQGRLEGDLAIHRARGDGGDVILEADLVGQFVDAFLVDHGRIHVGDQDLLAAVRSLLDDDVERLAGRAPRASAWQRPSASARPAGKCEVAGDVLGQPGMALAPTAREAIFASGRDKSRAAGWEISVATSGMEDSGSREGCIEERDPDSRADRQRQVGAGAGSRRAHRRRRSSTPIPCRSMRCSTC